MPSLLHDGSLDAVFAAGVPSAPFEQIAERVRRAVAEPLSRGAFAEAMVIAAKHGEAAAEEVLRARAEGGHARLPIACARGCSHCCYLRVEITAVEAKILAQAVIDAGDGERLRSIREKALSVGELALPERLAARTPCALLSADGACTVHASRPLVCRAANSSSSEACARLVATGDASASLPLDVWTFASLRAAYLGFRAGLDDAGESAVRYELHLAMSKAVDELLE